MANTSKKNVSQTRKAKTGRGTGNARGSVELLHIESRALKGNHLKDPTDRLIPVYLPPGYHESEKRYPVLVGLTGFTGSGRQMLNAVSWGEALNERLDRLQHEGRIGPMIVVMPDCFTRLGGSQYLNSSATGNYEDHLIKEVIPAVDEKYRTLAQPRHRGVFGKSSGGYGALVLGMKHPSVFGGIACHSGDMAFEYGYLPDFPKFLRVVEDCGGVSKFIKAFEVAGKKTGSMIGAMNILAMAACYSPNSNTRPLGFDLPMDLHTGALLQVVWRRWLRHDPLRMLPRYAKSLSGARLLYLDCGRLDEFNLHLGARQFVAALKKLRLSHVYEEFEDGHMGLNYRYDHSFPRLWKALKPGGRA